MQEWEVSSSMNPKVSVIIPVYHPKKEYMDRLLDSIVRQTIGIENMEVILVSDGDQTESTKSVLSAWEERYPDNFLVIYYEENQRPGYARTLGMEYARGEYIAFADQDDWLSLEMYRILVEKAQQYSCEITGGFSTRDRDYIRPEIERVYTGDEDVLWDIQDSETRKEFLINKKMGGYWCSIYRRDFLLENAIYFPAGVTYDDNFFGKLCSYYVKRILIVGEYFYHWFVNEQSISMVQDGASHFDRLQVELLAVDALKERGFFEEYKAEIEIQFLEIYYINTMHTFFWHLNYIPYNTYLEMCRMIQKEFPMYRLNPYFSSGIDTYESYTWIYYPAVYQYYCDRKDEEKIQILNQVPDRIKGISWIDTMAGNLTEEELTWFKIIYMLLPSS